MKTLTKILIAPLIAVAFLLFSCSDNGDDDPKLDCGPSYCISDLAGTWNATALTFTECNGPGFIDLIAEGGSASIVIQTSGRFTLTINYPEGTEVFTGKMYFEDGRFYSIQFDDDPPNDPTYFGDTLSGNTFSLNGGPETAEFDFDEDGNEECASVDLTFVRA